MTMPITFSITRNGEPIGTVEFESEVSRHTLSLDMNEVQPYGFEISAREADTEYAIWIGDIECGRAAKSNGQPASTIGSAKGRYVLWDDALYFEGTRGLLWLRIRSRTINTERYWEDRVYVSVVVTSGKLSVDRYRAMLEQMTSLASGLVLDLVSKSLRATKLSFAESEVQVRTSAVELRILETLWPAIALNLSRIVRMPTTRLCRKIVNSNCWGSERLDTRSIVTLTRYGNDPRHPGANLPFRTQISRIEESTATHEHSVIRAFLDLLHQRALECEANLGRHIAAIQQDRVWRDRPSGVGGSLFALEDVPRLERLQNRLQRTRELIFQISQARRFEPFASVKPLMDFSPTPVFSNVGPYRDVRHDFLRFLKSGLVIVDEGVDARLKSTSRIFEQWVFLQLVAAFRFAGLFCASQRGILYTTQRFRFTLDLDRGAKATFIAPDGRAVIVRYEPWVMPFAAAKQNCESVFRGKSSDAAWSPDVLIEFLSGPEEAGQSPLVEYAVVVDAKYSSSIREHHWNDTAKYLDIRSTATNRQVVRQQWLAYPGSEVSSDFPIQIRDAAVRWSADGPDCPRDETLQGLVVLMPPRAFDVAAVANGWIAKPEPASVAFVFGLLRYMNFEVTAPDLFWNAYSDV